MFYLLGTLTFLASILFYSLSPRSDNVVQMDIPTAKIAAQELINQHSAALQAASMIIETIDEETETTIRKMAYEDWNYAATSQGT